MNGVIKMISISNFVKSFLLTSIIFLVSFICLFTQNNKSNQANDYQLIYIFSIHDCPACIAYINEDIKCVNKKYQNVEVCGYILCDRKKEQKKLYQIPRLASLRKGRSKHFKKRA